MCQGQGGLAGFTDYRSERLIPFRSVKKDWNIFILQIVRSHCDRFLSGDGTETEETPYGNNHFEHW